MLRSLGHSQTNTESEERCQVMWQRRHQRQTKAEHRTLNPHTDAQLSMPPLGHSSSGESDATLRNTF